MGSITPRVYKKSKPYHLSPTNMNTALEPTFESAPDAAKLEALAGRITMLDIPTMTSDFGKMLMPEIRHRIQSLAEWIETQSDTL